LHNTLQLNTMEENITVIKTTMGVFAKDQVAWKVFSSLVQCHLRNDLCCFEWNAKPLYTIPLVQQLLSVCVVTSLSVSQSVSGTLDRPWVVAPCKTCGHVRSSRRRWRWTQCRPRSVAPTFGSVPCWCFHSGLMSGLPPARASTARRSGLVSLPVVASRDQKWKSPTTNPDC